MLSNVLTKRKLWHILMSKGVGAVSTNTVRIDDDIHEETLRIATGLGLTFNSVVNILLRKFVAEKGFPFPLKLESETDKTVFEMDSEEFIAACKTAVANRNANPVHDFVTLFDAETGKLVKKYDDGRTEYVIG